jgi:pimeloyl-ACP methyl ester carboxylesterase
MGELMAPTTHQVTLAFERHGSGAPIALLPGLTFDRRVWRPIIERLGDEVCSVAIDLPAHGDSPGPAADLERVAARAHELLARLDVREPVVVGHSSSGGLAMIYAAEYPARGVVMIDSPVDLRPFATLVRRLEPVLRGPGFADAFEPFQRSMGLDLVPEPLRTTALAAQKTSREVVLGSWDQLLRTDPAQLQRWFEGIAREVHVPCLAVFGHELSPGERDQLLGLVPHAQIEDWAGCGHFVHLADADRFTARLRAFVDGCWGAGS